jgi:four helix bundle protein
MSEGYRNLKVWHRAYEMTLKIYEVTSDYPKDERFGMISQMRKASVSTIANLAEGYSKRHLNDYIHFITTSIGSNNELNVYILLSRDLKYITKNEYDELKPKCDEISKMLFGLRKALTRKNQH